MEDHVAYLGSGADTADETSQIHRQLDEIDDAVGRLPVPIQFAEQFYNLRTHLDLVRERLKSKAPGFASA